METLDVEHVAPRLREIEAAAEALAGRVVTTPVVALASDRIRRHLPPESLVAIKLELFQHAGSFKSRAALLHIDGLDAEARRRGVTAVSAGNHALAVSWA
ncbi:MAG: pyridoxal-phosphate dependent enzyme, partial [Geminicoccales bacterium]